MGQRLEAAFSARNATMKRFNQPLKKNSEAQKPSRDGELDCPGPRVLWKKRGKERDLHHARLYLLSTGSTPLFATLSLNHQGLQEQYKGG